MVINNGIFIQFFQVAIREGTVQIPISYSNNHYIIISTLVGTDKAYMAWFQITLSKQTINSFWTSYQGYGGMGSGSFKYYYYLTIGY